MESGSVVDFFSLVLTRFPDGTRRHRGAQVMKPSTGIERTSCYVFV